jgi:hypothetical protein
MLHLSSFALPYVVRTPAAGLRKECHPVLFYGIPQALLLPGPLSAPDGGSMPCHYREAPNTTRHPRLLPVS